MGNWQGTFLGNTEGWNRHSSAYSLKETQGNELWKSWQSLSVLWSVYVTKITGKFLSGLPNTKQPIWPCFFCFFFLADLTKLPNCFVFVWTEPGNLLMKPYFMLMSCNSCRSPIWNNLMRYWFAAQQALNNYQNCEVNLIRRRGERKVNF